jgi:phosphoribosylanthranilate isomerase
MTKVKICGITNPEDARAAVSAGCDALGFVFFEKSPRYIRPEEAGRIIKTLPRRVEKVGVFCNARERTIAGIIGKCGLTMVQMHGDESAGFCRRFKVPVIKAFRIKNTIDMAGIKRYNTFAYLFDTYHNRLRGGSGRVFDWRCIDVKAFDRPVFLAGGLTVGNVASAVSAVDPAWVDASSSLETVPGRKDHRRVREFISRVRDADVRKEREVS